MTQNYAELSSAPPRYAIHALPGGMAQITFYHDAERLPPTGDEDGERWGAHYYIMTTRNSPNLAARIEANYSTWVAAAMEQDKARVEAEVRKQRDTALAETDYLLTPDYPITDDARAQLVAYRQALRDLPATEGWPEHIKWPDKPETGSGGPNGTLVSKVDELAKQNEVFTECLLEISGEVYG